MFYKYVIFGSTIITIIFMVIAGSYKKKYNILQQQYNQLHASYIVLEQNYDQLYKNYQSLLNEVKLNEEKYKRAMSNLLRLANKPPTRIEVPISVTKEIIVNEEDCKKLFIMIDETINVIQQEENRDEK